MEAYAQKIKFNGKDYASKDEMPAADRAAFDRLTGFFADKNNDGVPDCFEASSEVQVGSCMISAKLNNGKQEILINGKTYASADEMPAEDRHVYDAALSLIDKNGNGIPDAFENLSAEKIQSAFGTNFQATVLSRGRKRSDNHAGPGKLLLRMVATLCALTVAGYFAVLVWENMR